MGKTNLKRAGAIAAACTVMMLLASAAHAVTLKASGHITGDAVTVGDVFDGAGGYADRFLAPAPATGKPLTLGVNDLTRISTAFNLGWKPAAQGEYITLRHAAAADPQVVDHQTIATAVKQKLAKELKGRKFDMELDSRALSLHLPADAKQAVQVDNIDIDLQNSRFSALVTAAGNTRKQVEGSVYVIASVPVLKDPLRKGDIIAAQDIEYVDMRAKDISATMIVDAKKLIGQTPRRGLAALKPVMAGDVAAPQVVKKGDTVTVTLKTNALNLTMQGRALQNGAEGDTVRIINTASNRTVDAIVTGPQTVTVTTPVL